MKKDLAKLVELDATLGEISETTYKNAQKESTGLATMMVLTFIVATLLFALGVGFLIGGLLSFGGGFMTGAMICLFGNRYARAEMDKNDLIRLAYTQRDQLRALRGDNVFDISTESKKRSKK